MKTVQIDGGFWVPDDTHLGRWQIESRKLCHDEFLPYCADPFVPVGGTVIDCGAFNGDHTIHYSDLVGESGRVIGVEPGEVAFRCLAHNRALFMHMNVEILRAAISDSIGSGGHHEHENLGASRFAEGNGGIKVTTIDEIVQYYDLKRVDFIKLDIEGFEAKAIRGASQTVKRWHPTILFEVNPSALMAAGSSVEDLLGLLDGYGLFCVNDKIDPGQYDVIAFPI